MIWAVVIGGRLCAISGGRATWLQLTDYVQQTREELRKCTWPTWDELKGSTVVVTISIVLLGGFIVLVDQVVLPAVFMFFKL